MTNTVIKKTENRAQIFRLSIPHRQAKSEVKDQNAINRSKKINYNQTGGKTGKKKSTRSKTKKRVVVKKKIKNQGLA